VEMPFTKAITDVTDMSPRRRRNGDRSVGYSGQAAAIRREQCGMTTGSQNRETRDDCCYVTAW
jgi:hypothetical protein